MPAPPADSADASVAALTRTFSIWSSEAARAAFVQAPVAHRPAVARTRTAGWSAEELFARFAIVSSYGTIDGCDPLNPSR
jgi:hypothetical protein